MRIALVGTDLAPARPGAGALETLLTGWATGLAADHDVTVVSVGTHPGPDPSAPPYRTAGVGEPAALRPLFDALEPDVVILNNRPAWQAHVDGATLHLFHNWPDAWQVPEGPTAAELVAGAGAAAVSGSLAAVVATTLGRAGSTVAVVAPFVDGDLLEVEARPEPGLVLAPNRLMIKKGVRELTVIAAQPSMRGRRVLITDYLSPWTAPTPEHMALRAIVAASPAKLVPPPAGRAAMAALYARAEVVVCPSIRPEGLGLTAVEAQAVGVPVVSSGLGGLREACLRADLIADPNDPAAFAAAIARAAGLDAGVRLDLRRTIQARYSPPASLASLLAALARARPGPRRSR